MHDKYIIRLKLLPNGRPVARSACLAHSIFSLPTKILHQEHALAGVKLITANEGMTKFPAHLTFLKAYSTSPCWMHKRVQKSFDGHRSCTSTGKLDNYYIWCLFFFSGFMKSSEVYATRLCTIVRLETMIWPSTRFGMQYIKDLSTFSDCK